jgi:hypothetical protein
VSNVESLAVREGGCQLHAGPQRPPTPPRLTREQLGQKQGPPPPPPRGSVGFGSSRLPLRAPTCPRHARLQPRRRAARPLEEEGGGGAA